MKAASSSVLQLATKALRCSLIHSYCDRVVEIDRTFHPIKHQCPSNVSCIRFYILFNRALTSLNLRNNGIGVGGTKAIADSLPQFSTCCSAAICIVFCLHPTRLPFAMEAHDCNLVDHMIGEPLYATTTSNSSEFGSELSSSCTLHVEE